MSKSRFSSSLIFNRERTRRVWALHEETRRTSENILLKNTTIIWLTKITKRRNRRPNDLNAKRNDGECKNQGLKGTQRAWRSWRRIVEAIRKYCLQIKCKIINLIIIF